LQGKTDHTETRQKEKKKKKQRTQSRRASRFVVAAISLLFLLCGARALIAFCFPHCAARVDAAEGGFVVLCFPLSKKPLTHPSAITPAHLPRCLLVT
jgi:hypothetical protein